MIKVGVIGYGHIGQAVDYMLRLACPDYYDVTCYDVVDKPHGSDVKLEVTQDIKKMVTDNDYIVVCTPYSINQQVVYHVANQQKVYFDLTEDNSVAKYVHDTVNIMGGACITQCGLAPGAVSIIAANLIKEFSSIDAISNITDIEIRVGALPISANNEIKYYLSWSPEGLVNEYCNPCKAVKDYRYIEVEPLEGYETVVIEGVEYEAFNTSGGIGSLIERMKEYPTIPVKNINYKTLRYKGHRDRINFLVNDLGLRHNKQLMVDIFKQNVPYIHDDVVLIYIEVTGYIDGQLRVKQYTKAFFGEPNLSAIQLTTAGGVCTAIEWYRQNNPTERVIYNHDINVDPETNPFWSIFG